MGPRMFHQQFMFGNFFRIVGLKGEVWGIFLGAGKIIDMNDGVCTYTKRQ